MRQKSLNSILGSAASAFSPGSSGNMSESSSASFAGFSPTTILENFIPGYGHIHKIFLYNFGLDVTMIVSFGAALWVSARLLQSAKALVWTFLNAYFMAEITVSSTDEIHGHLIQFLAHQYKISSSRRLMAETPSKSAWELDSEDTGQSIETSVDATGKIKWLNFSNQEAKSQPRFTPAIGSHNFWHKGTYFQLKRKEVSVFDTLGGGATSFKDKEVLTLSCFGRSTDPIKALIQHAKGHYHLGHKAKTIIKRPAPKDMRRFGGRGAWVKIAERPCRPMRTVVLDEERKMDVLVDINEYLNPVTARWYANRGIPYRRGYLFYGPPGTGKTSLTFALAGVFGLDIHVVSLLEPTLTEEELGMLFTNLPARCIVLLEDIDTAGLIRNEPTETAEERKGDGEKDGQRGFDVGDLTKAFKKASQMSEEERKKGISLSGLLNIIDGVASHEGRVLVMTTNHPEKLDEALIRPGRVDHQVPFDYASQHQIRELFVRMYRDDLELGDETTTIVTTEIKNKSEVTPAIIVLGDNEKACEGLGVQITPPLTPVIDHHTTHSHCVEMTEKATSDLALGLDRVKLGLDDIANQFSERIPGGVFSPAEIQGFLLKRKKDPRRALGEVSDSRYDNDETITVLFASSTDLRLFATPLPLLLIQITCSPPPSFLIKSLVPVVSLRKSPIEVKEGREAMYFGPCDRWFTDTEYYQHIANNAQHQTLAYDCEVCDRGFATEESLWQHQESASDHPFCAECRRMFHQHSKLHTQLQIPCPFCTCNYATASGLIIHLESGACASTVNRQRVNASIRRIDRTYRITKPQLGLRLGPYGVKRGQASEVAWNGKAYGCYLCPRGFATLFSLNRHLGSVAHEQDLYNCPKPTCGRKYKLLSGLIMHVESESCNVMPFSKVQRWARNGVGGVVGGLIQGPPAAFEQEVY
ncbi:hypothetical protein HYALB_00005056 [Hymenoscyphus albidus]|uniref:C2H2-type domain-containing protein n=1 Tax=Hymenoscyphus albidus TaxID=595503 RepID=A0A9N9Q915_9HELO|nr:hypothetical protein HYALB_00005056 [Hymenoscyphus albidus]